jgi:hypothetical protein
MSSVAGLHAYYPPASLGVDKQSDMKEAAARERLARVE